MTTNDVQFALIELERELGVRQRCYPQWIAGGKLGKWEAKDRVERLERAITLLEALHVHFSAGKALTAVAKGS